MITMGLVLMGAGVAVVAAFVWLNLRDTRDYGGNGLPGGAVRERSVGFGLASAAVLFVGVVIFSLGAAIVGTTMGYGRF